MKKLNKKGFTLVELLAVIVILALLIVVVATTALPAMNNAKKSALDTYAKRVIEQTKVYYTTECVLKNATCDETSWDLKTIMGEDVNEQYELTISDITNANGVIKVKGTVTDTKNSISVDIEDSKIVTTTTTTTTAAG